MNFAAICRTFMFYVYLTINGCRAVECRLRDDARGLSQVPGAVPQQGIVFRDGVSSSQVETVVKQEVRPCRKDFKIIKTNKDKLNKLQMAGVIVQKRVIARFLDENYNSLNQGTVIDSGVNSNTIASW
eukprot:483675_1